VQYVGQKRRSSQCGCVEREGWRKRAVLSCSDWGEEKYRDKERRRQISLFLRNSCHFENTKVPERDTADSFGLPNIAGTAGS